MAQTLLFTWSIPSTRSRKTCDEVGQFVWCSYSMNQPIITNPTLQFASSSGASSIPLKLEQDTCALCDASDKKARVITTVRPLKPGWAWVASKLKWMKRLMEMNYFFWHSSWQCIYLQFLITSRQMVTSIYNHLQLAAWVFAGHMISSYCWTACPVNQPILWEGRFVDETE